MNREEYRNGIILGGCTAIALLVIVLAFKLTEAPINKTTHDQLQNNLSELLVKGSYDNNPATDIIFLNDTALGSTEQQPIYRARASGKPTGAVVTAVAPDGYNGAIDLLVGFDFDGSVVAVRVTRHQETPGLGDDIEDRRSDWIQAFDGLSPNNMQPSDWQVKKDGGQFDQFTGATITPRAVVRAVQKTTAWYQNNRDTLFMSNPE